MNNNFHSKLPYAELMEFRWDGLHAVEYLVSFNIMSELILLKYMYGSPNAFTNMEQNVFDAERECLRFGIRVKDAPQFISKMTAISEPRVLVILDKIEAKCYYRASIELDPIPERKTKDRYLGYFDKFPQLIGDYKIDPS